MASKLSITIDPEPSIISDHVRCTIEFNDPDMMGCDAEIKITTTVKVDDKSPVNEIKTHVVKKLKIDKAKIRFEIPSKHLNQYSYLGFDVDITNEIHVVVDDAIFFDSKLSKPITRQIIKKPELSDQAGTLAAPHDKQRFFKNLFALPPNERRMIIITMMIGYSMMAGILFLAGHDLYTGKELAYLYSLYSFEPAGRVFFIIVVTLIASIMSYGVIQTIIHVYLSSWLKVSINRKRLLKSFAADGSCRVSDLIRGKTSIPVDSMCVRIVACNMECGQYIRSNGSTTETISFKRPIREFILYEKKIQNITKGIAIETYLSDTIHFDKLYKNLYPKNMLSKTHGIDLHWEIQFLHDDFLDHEIDLPIQDFNNTDFYK